MLRARTHFSFCLCLIGTLVGLNWMKEVTGSEGEGTNKKGPLGNAHSYSFIVNQRPRFNIPRGNLPYSRIPQWEILYFLKFGTPPPHQARSWRAEDLIKMKQIKKIQDKFESETKTTTPNPLAEIEAQASIQGERKLTFEPSVSVNALLRTHTTDDSNHRTERIENGFMEAAAASEIASLSVPIVSFLKDFVGIWGNSANIPRYGRTRKETVMPLPAVINGMRTGYRRQKPIYGI